MSNEQALADFVLDCYLKLKGALSVQYGRKYCKVLRNDVVLCFVETDTGIVYRARTPRDPLTNFPRGSILDGTALEQMGPDGPAKMHNGKPKGFKHDLIYPRGARKALGPQPRIPLEKKGHAAHRPERIRAHTEPLVVVTAPIPLQIPLAQQYRILPPNIFTP